MASVSVPLCIKGASMLAEAPKVGPAMLLTCEFVMPLGDLVNAMAKYQMQHEAAPAACAEPRSAPSAGLNPKATPFPTPETKPEVAESVALETRELMQHKVVHFEDLDAAPCASAGAAAAAPAPAQGRQRQPLRQRGASPCAAAAAAPAPAWGDGVDMGDIGLIPWKMRQAMVTWDDDILDVRLMRESYEEAERQLMNYRRKTSWATRDVDTTKVFLSPAQEQILLHYKPEPLQGPTSPAQGARAQGSDPTADGIPAQGAPAQGAPAQGAPAQGDPALGAPAQGKEQRRRAPIVYERRCSSYRECRLVTPLPVRETAAEHRQGRYQHPPNGDCKSQ